MIYLALISAFLVICLRVWPEFRHLDVADWARYEDAPKGEEE